MTATTDAAWLAGLLEGEATFDGAARTPRIQLVMGDRDVVERAAALMGAAGRVNAVKYKVDRTQMWRVYACGDNARRTMKMVRPYMGLRRGAKTDSILAADQAKGAT